MLPTHRSQKANNFSRSKPSRLCTIKSFSLTLFIVLISIYFIYFTYVFKSINETTPLPQVIKDPRQQKIVDAFIHAMDGYFKYAYGHDEVRPTSNITNDSWGGFGVTLIDSIDTIYVMSLEERYESYLLDHLRSLDFNKDWNSSLFETTIRYVGGLISGYEFSKNRLFLEKALQLADRLIPAFNTSTLIPFHKVNLKTGKAANPSWTNGHSILAEAGSIQLEFYALSHYSFHPKYANLGDSVYETMYKAMKNQSLDGLYPVYINPDTGFFKPGTYSLGGLGDSFYEYLLKRWLLTGRQEKKYLQMWRESMKSVTSKMMKRSKGPENLLFIGEIFHDQLTGNMDHLVCYVPGMFALGSYYDRNYSSYLLPLSEELMRTCYYLYSSQPSHLSPDRVEFIFEDQMNTFSSRPGRLGKETITKESNKPNEASLKQKKEVSKEESINEKYFKDSENKNAENLMSFFESPSSDSLNQNDKSPRREQGNIRGGVELTRNDANRRKPLAYPTPSPPSPVLSPSQAPRSREVPLDLSPPYPPHNSKSIPKVSKPMVQSDPLKEKNPLPQNPIKERSEKTENHPPKQSESQKEPTKPSSISKKASPPGVSDFEDAQLFGKLNQDDFEDNNVQSAFEGENIQKIPDNIPHINLYNPDFEVRSTNYVLRPETLESLYILYQITGNKTYQDWAWNIFLAIEKHCKTETAYSGIKDVTLKQTEHNNSMQSFFFAETLKYLYLIFGERGMISFDEWVFTTEAHLFKIPMDLIASRKKTQTERIERKTNKKSQY